MHASRGAAVALAFADAPPDQPLVEDDFEAVLDVLGSDEPPPRATTTRAEWTPPAITSLRELLSNPLLLRLPDAVAPRLAWRGMLSMLAGREKSGKSTLARAAAAAVSHGGAFLDGSALPGIVLYLALEESPGTVARSLREHAADPDALLVVTNMPDGTRQRINFLREAIAEHSVALVVIDALLAFASDVRDANAAAQMSPLVQALANTAHDTDAAILLLHHAKKSDGGYRDSSAIGAAVDVILEMREPERTGDSTLRIVDARGRIPVEPFRFRYTDARHVVAGDQSDDAGIEARVFAFVFGNPGASQDAVRRGVSGRNDAINRALAVLLAAGRVVDRGSGSRRAYHAVNRPDDPADELPAVPDF